MRIKTIEKRLNLLLEALDGYSADEASSVLRIVEYYLDMRHKEYYSTQSPQYQEDKSYIERYISQHKNCLNLDIQPSLPVVNLSNRSTQQIDFKKVMPFLDQVRRGEIAHGPKKFENSED